MKLKSIYIVLITLIPLMAYGRLFRIVDPKELIANSQLVFVGKVQSVKASGLATPLGYPTWEGASFPWLRVGMKVLFSFKGVHQDDVVQVMMLSMDTNAESRMYSPPEVLEPDKDDVFFVCLGPTTITNTFAALTAPYDENLSVFPLYRSHEILAFNLRDDGKQLLKGDERFAPIWTLVNQSGVVVPDKATKLRNIYAAEIRKSPAHALVYLEWQSCTNVYGWVTDVPKSFSPTNSDSKQ